MKRTIFEGVVNGEKFDNINDYNTRVKELMDSGKFESASSSTRVEEYKTSGVSRACDDQSNTTCTEIPSFSNEVSTTATTYDEELSMYPFMDDDFGLNILNNYITKNTEKNKEIFKNIDRVLSKCFPYIMENLAESTVDIVEKREYLNDVKEIIDCLVKFKDCAHSAIAVITDKQDNLNKEYCAKLSEFDDEFNKKWGELDNKLTVLKEGNNVFNKFIDFYRDVQSEAFIILKNADKAADSENTCKCEDGKCKCEDGKCNCENGCNCEDDDLTKIVTSFVEKIPQGDPSPITALVNRIFGDTLSK